MRYRKLTEKEIESLKQNGCFCKEWGKILVADPFNCDRVLRVNFSGSVQIGQLNKVLNAQAGPKRRAGLYNSSIHNCIIEDNVYISNVDNLANYKIETDVVIENCKSITVNGKTTFGNGTVLKVLNESGGRELKIFDWLTSQIAYLIVMYRHNSVMIKKLEKMIDLYVKEKRNSIGSLKKGCRIINTVKLFNVEVGPFTEISGALCLEEGTINSCSEDPVIIGDGVIIKHFIIQSGSRIESSAILDRCYIGQGVKLGKQFSAENSVFFAYCEGFGGEASSLFAGPYTVTHHKSTLLIAGYFSFFNAGSGTNQSNHRDKFGPIHQGILERGCKTGSFAYLLWPCRVGAFTAVIGKHYSNFDTHDFPFSYISEEEGKSILQPAVNFFTVGTWRDVEKWPSRDRHKDSDKLDLIIFELFSPYIVKKMLNGIELLENIYTNTLKKSEYVKYNGIMIKRLLLRTSAKYYSMGVKIALGESILSRLGKISEYKNFNRIKKRLVINSTDMQSKWVDIAGMVCRESSLNKIIKSVEQGKIKNINELMKRLKDIHDNYSDEKWKFYCGLLENQIDVRIKNMNADQFARVIENWRESKVRLNNMILKDAGKEFDINTQIGFGIDGDDGVREKDFQAVRGMYDKNTFVKNLQDEIEEVEKIAEKILCLIKKGLIKKG